MNDLQKKIVETMDTIYDQFCKYSNTGDDNGCVYCQTHCGKCPFDDLAKEIEK